MLGHLVEGHVPVGPAERESEARAGGGERLEAERGEDTGRAGVPRVGDDERFTLVEGAETLRLLRLPGQAELRSPWASGRVSSFFSVLFSIWRMRSRVTPKAWPTSSSV